MRIEYEGQNRQGIIASVCEKDLLSLINRECLLSENLLSPPHLRIFVSESENKTGYYFVETLYNRTIYVDLPKSSSAHQLLNHLIRINDRALPIKNRAQKTNPTTRATHPFFKLRTYPFNMFSSRLRCFDRYDPANPLIAR